MSKKIIQKNKIRDLYESISFLVPLIIGSILSGVIYDSSFWVNSRESAVIIIYVIIFLALIFTVSMWNKYDRPDKGEEEKKRGKELGRDLVIFQVEKMIFVLLLLGFFLIYGFFVNQSKHPYSSLLFLVIGILFCFISYKMFKNVENNYKKYFCIFLGFFILLFAYLFLFYMK